MLEFIIGSILGFTAGCSLKDLITSKLNSLYQARSLSSPHWLHVKNADSVRANSSKNNSVYMNDSFNLASIKSLFDKYEVKLVGANSFSILLDKMERTTYLDTLKLFSTSVHSPKDLVNLLESGNTQDEKIAIEKSNEKLMVSDAYINNILIKEGIDYSSIQLIEEKIQLLVSFYISKGLKQFQKTMGPSLKQFLTDYKEKKDVMVLYDGIMIKVNKALDFLS